MKVRCIQLLDEDSGEAIESSSWLSVGRVYHVLSIHMQAGYQLKFQLIGNDGITPAFHSAEQFEVTSDHIPSNWSVSSVAGSHFELAPRAWSSPGFWESYFDGDSDALSLFEREQEAMLEEEP
jgi:hypothetical protein